MILTSGTDPKDSIKGLTDMVAPVSLTTKTPWPKAQVSQLESNSALTALLRLGTAAARIERRAAHPLPPLGLEMPGPLLVAAAGSSGSSKVTAAPAVRGLAAVVALAALHLAISSSESVLHSAGE
jgi:hypothetical protein